MRRNQPQERGERLGQGLGRRGQRIVGVATPVATGRGHGVTTEAGSSVPDMWRPPAIRSEARRMDPQRGRGKDSRRGYTR